MDRRWPDRRRACQSGSCQPRISRCATKASISIVAICRPEIRIAHAERVWENGSLDSIKIEHLGEEQPEIALSRARFGMNIGDPPQLRFNTDTDSLLPEEVNRTREAGSNRKHPRKSRVANLAGRTRRMGVPACSRLGSAHCSMRRPGPCAGHGSNCSGTPMDPLPPVRRRTQDANKPARWGKFPVADCRICAFLRGHSLANCASWNAVAAPSLPYVEVSELTLLTWLTEAQRSTNLCAFSPISAFVDIMSRYAFVRDDRSLRQSLPTLYGARLHDVTEMFKKQAELSEQLRWPIESQLKINRLQQGLSKGSRTETNNDRRSGCRVEGMTAKHLWNWQRRS